MHETTESMSGSLDCVQRPESKVHRGVIYASVLRKRECVDGNGGYLVRIECACRCNRCQEELREQRPLYQWNARLLGC